MNLIILSCKRITELSCSEENLNQLDSWRLALHLVICKACKAYHQQMRLIRLHMKANLEKKSQVDPQQVELLEKEILKKFKDGLN